VINKEIKEVKNNEVNTLMLDIMKEIKNSEDEVSKTLSLIFDKAIPHSSEELQRARERRELGNPPGKMTDSIGDQLAWEQILTHFRGKKRLWIITKDSDYSEFYGNETFLSRFLYNELCSISSEPEVYLFQNMVKGIRDFIKKTCLKDENSLTVEEVQDIENEEKSVNVKHGLSLHFRDDLDTDSWMKATVCPSCRVRAVFPQLYSTGYRYTCANCGRASSFFPADDQFFD